jgi:RNA polymerase sigma factor (sigma-70 family)
MAVLRAEIAEATIRIPYWVRFPNSDEATKRRIARIAGRVAQAKRFASLSAFATDPIAVAGDPAERDEAETLAADVRKAMRSLHPREREIVKTTVIDGELLKDVAARRGVTKQAVHQTRAKAFAKLRAHSSLADYATEGV